MTNRRGQPRPGIALALLLAIGGCAGGGATREPGAAVPVYRLAPDDRLRVTVYGEEGLTGTFVIGSEGKVSFPLLGMIKASGLTVSQFQAALADQLDSQYVKNAKVSVDILEYRPFYILGEVNRAGQYPYRVGLTVNQAVATAGGFTYRASRKVVTIQHSNEPDEERLRLTPDLKILPGDTLRVLERHF